MLRALRTVDQDKSTTPIDSVRLDFEARRKRRQRLRTNGGMDFIVDLPKAPELRDGHGYVLEDGRIIAVEASAEDLLEITAADWPKLLRIAWHLGNRHLPTELKDQRLRILNDHVIRAMVEQLGGTVRPIKAAFEPEGGAYGHGTIHSHD